jgi:seryl-tRNA synthetase
MLDPKFIREQPDAVKDGVRKKGGNPSIVDEFLTLDTERRTLVQATEARQAELNAASAKMAQATPEEREAMREELRSLSDAVKTEQANVADMDKAWVSLLRQIPNIPAADVPEGASEKDNVVVRTEGTKPEFSFQPKDHEELALKLNLLDLERGSKVSGAKFYYLKDELVLLEQAVMRLALDTVKEQGFSLLGVPHLARAAAFYGTGHFVTAEDAIEGDIYHTERDDLYLAGTAEIGLINYRADEILTESELPLRYAAYSPCYRREAGTYGRETRGLYRVHQFYKVEMVALVKPEEAQAEHERLLTIAENLLKKLGLHYQVVLNCGGDLGHPQVKKWDIETWLPGMNKFGETHSCSNDTDYQSRSLNIRYKNTEGATVYVHTLNNTVLASPRILVAILENYQQEDGSIVIPEALHSYTGFHTISARSI